MGDTSGRGVFWLCGWSAPVVRKSQTPLQNQCLDPLSLFEVCGCPNREERVFCVAVLSGYALRQFARRPIFRFSTSGELPKGIGTRKYTYASVIMMSGPRNHMWWHSPRIGSNLVGSRCCSLRTLTKRVCRLSCVLEPKVGSLNS